MGCSHSNGRFPPDKDRPAAQIGRSSTPGHKVSNNGMARLCLNSASPSRPTRAHAAERMSASPSVGNDHTVAASVRSTPADADRTPHHRPTPPRSHDGGTTPLPDLGGPGPLLRACGKVGEERRGHSTRTAGTPAPAGEQDDARAARATDPPRLRAIERQQRRAVPQAGSTPQPSTFAVAVPDDVVELPLGIHRWPGDRGESDGEAPCRFAHDHRLDRHGSPAGAPDRLVAHPPQHRPRREAHRRRDHCKRNGRHDVAAAGVRDQE